MCYNPHYGANPPGGAENSTNSQVRKSQQIFRPTFLGLNREVLEWPNSPIALGSDCHKILNFWVELLVLDSAGWSVTVSKWEVE